MHYLRFLSLLFAFSVLQASSGSGCLPPQQSAGRINNLKVLSSAMDDVTTSDNFLKSFIKPGMSDEERAKSIWTGAVR